MYLEKMNEEEMGVFCDKLTIKEMDNIYVILNDYIKLNNANMDLFNNYNKKYNEQLECTLYTSDLDIKILNAFEFKELLKKLQFGELYSFHNIINKLSDELKTDYYKNLLYIVKNILAEYKEFIMKYKRLENMDKDELEYFLDNISSNALENYSIAINSKNITPTIEEMYNFYNNLDIKEMRLKR